MEFEEIDKAGNYLGIWRVVAVSRTRVEIDINGKHIKGTVKLTKKAFIEMLKHPLHTLRRVDRNGLAAIIHALKDD
jgi:hypothetical protein